MSKINKVRVNNVSYDIEPHQSTRFLGNYTEFNTAEKAIDLNSLELNVLYVIGDIDEVNADRRIYMKATYEVSGEEKTFTAKMHDTNRPSVSNFYFFMLTAPIPEVWSTEVTIGKYWYEGIWDNNGYVIRTIQFITLKNNGISASGSANPLFIGLNDTTQDIWGVKTFRSIPKQYDTTAPTQDKEFTNKKYVDDSDKALLDNIASAYDATSTYDEGDYVIYNGLLYKCNTTISTAEAWTAAHWTQTTVMAELKSQITSALNGSY